MDHEHANFDQYYIEIKQHNLSRSFLEREWEIFVI